MPSPFTPVLLFFSYATNLRFWATLDAAELERQRNDAKGEAPSSPHALPEFPLVPVSRGFCISVQRSLDSLVQIVNSLE